VRQSRQELGAGRAASLLKPHEPHPATIPHQSTTPGAILALPSLERCGVVGWCGLVEAGFARLLAFEIVDIESFDV
jgi:hypothetical protein